MLKLIGALAIIAASAGFLSEWRKSCILRIRQMEQICALLRKAYHEMETERIHMPVFFERYAKIDHEKENAVAGMAGKLGEFLCNHTYASGEEAWRQAFLYTEETWYLQKEEKELLLNAGGAFFGRKLAENLQKLRLYEEQMQSCCQSARAEYTEKNKVLTPVGLLMGVMLIVILI